MCDFAQGACLGIPAITAHRCVQVAGSVAGRTVLVQGGAGAVGVCAVHSRGEQGRLSCARPCGRSPDEAVALEAGADHVLRPGADLIDRGSGAGSRRACITSSRWRSPQTSRPISNCCRFAGRWPHMQRTRATRRFRFGRCSSRTSASPSWAVMVVTARGAGEAARASRGARCVTLARRQELDRMRASEAIKGRVGWTAFDCK